MFVGNVNLSCSSYRVTDKTVERVWSVGSKPVGRKCKNDKAEIFRQKAENRKAENTVRPKNEAKCLLTFYY